MNNKSYDFIEDQNGRRRPIVDGKVHISAGQHENAIAALSPRVPEKKPDVLSMLRAEALLVCGYSPDHKGEIMPAEDFIDAHDRHKALLERTLGRVLLRYLNQRARAN